MSYKSKELGQISEANKEFERTGRPEVVAQIRLLVSQEAPFSKIAALINPKSEAKTAEQPPISGKGSGVEAWRDFAKEVSDLDAETVDSMSKEDLLTVLADEGLLEDD